jgi:hypothetical protein
MGHQSAKTLSSAVLQGIERRRMQLLLPIPHVLPLSVCSTVGLAAQQRFGT